MSSKEYILVDGKPVQCLEMNRWAVWMGTNNRTLGLNFTPKGAKVSTVFLGLDHNWGDGPPVLWETMVFGGPLEGEQDRYSSAQDAISGHQTMLKKALEAEGSQL